MGYLGHVLAGLMGLGLLAADVLILLLLVRLLRPHLRWRLVAAVDDAARPLVDGAVGAMAPAFQSSALSNDKRLRLCLLLLVVVRFALSLLCV